MGFFSAIRGTDVLTPLQQVKDASPGPSATSTFPCPPANAAGLSAEQQEPPAAATRGPWWDQTGAVTNLTQTQTLPLEAGLSPPASRGFARGTPNFGQHS